MSRRLVVLDSHDDLSSVLRDMLIEYYEENDHRMILNDSYSRYPITCDFGDEDFDIVDDFQEYLKSNNIINDKDCCVLIHWDW